MAAMLNGQVIPPVEMSETSHAGEIRPVHTRSLAGAAIGTETPTPYCRDSHPKPEVWASRVRRPERHCFLILHVVIHTCLCLYWLFGVLGRHSDLAQVQWSPLGHFLTTFHKQAIAGYFDFEKSLCRLQPLEGPFLEPLL